MACATLNHQPAVLSQQTDANNSVGAKVKAVLQRALHGIFESSHQRTDREIEHFLAQSGGRFTDNREREMMQHLGSSHWSVN